MKMQEFKTIQKIVSTLKEMQKDAKGFLERAKKRFLDSPDGDTFIEFIRADTEEIMYDVVLDEIADILRSIEKNGKS